MVRPRSFRSRSFEPSQQQDDDQSDFFPGKAAADADLFGETADFSDFDPDGSDGDDDDGRGSQEGGGAMPTKA